MAGATNIASSKPGSTPAIARGISGKRARMDLVDIAKGIAIVLMVFGHTEQGGMHRRWWDGSPHLFAGIKFADGFIYSFHMAAFFFVAGVFLEGSLARRGTWDFTLEKAKTILYPYVLWGVLGAAIYPLTAVYRMSQVPMNWTEILTNLANGNASWFLITLFVTFMLAVAICRLPHWCQMILAVAVSLVVPDKGITILYSPLIYLPFMVAGDWFGASRLRWLATLPRSKAWLGFLVLLAVQLATIWKVGAVNQWDKFPIGLVGIAMLLLFSHALAGTLSGRIFGWYGESSLAIFLISPYCQGATRELVLRVLHTTAALPQLLIPTFFSATLPPLLWHYQDALHITWLFRWPGGRSANRAPQPEQTRVV